MVCPDCKQLNIDTANYCVNCGYRLKPADEQMKEYAEHMAQKKESAVSFHFIDLFKSIFEKHYTDEIEDLFTVGTPSTTPEVGSLQDLHPHPWLFARALVVSYLLYLCFYLGLVVFRNQNFLPGLIMFGAFLSPLAILIFFWEINLPANISLYKVTVFFLVGGVVSLLYTVLLYRIVGGAASPLLIGFVEETAKLLAILIFARKTKYPYILNGLLIGAAIGTGFAAFESSGYIMMSAMKYGIQTMLSTIFWRDILAPGGHIAWAGLTGAAIVMVKADGRLRFRNLLRPMFIGIYLLVIFLHALWDLNVTQPFLPALPLFQVFLTVISWMALYWMIKKGILQISEKT